MLIVRKVCAKSVGLVG